MSQKKVDAYKARKSTRGRADKKEKMMFTLECLPGHLYVL